MVHLQSISILRVLFSAIFIGLFLSCTLEVAAQLPRAGSGEEEEMEHLYLLRSRYLANVVNNYTVKETVKTTRTNLADSSTAVFDRVVTKYVSLWCKSAASDGTTQLKALMDSIEYKGNLVSKTSTGEETSEEFYFHSEAGKGYVPPETWDFEANSALLNREYFFTLSPYGEFSSPKSEQIDWLKDYIVEVGKDLVDSVKKFVWLDAVDEPNLRFAAHPERNIIPQTQVKPDGVFSRPLLLRINHITFVADSSAISVLSFENRVFTIEAKAKLQPAREWCFTPFSLESKFLEIEEAECTATISIKLDKAGVIRSSDIAAEVKLVLNDGDDTFEETTVFENSMKLTEQYKW